MSWARQQLRHVADVSVSNVDKKSVEGDRPVRLVNYTDVYYGDRICPDQDLMGATATLSQVAAFSLRPGDVLITKDSETADDIGVAAYVEETDASMVLGYHLALLRPDPSELDGRYLYWVVCGDDAIGQLSVTATGVTRFGLRSDAIKGLSLAIPSLTEQRAIADYLDAETARIDALITKKHRLFDVLGERKRFCGEGEISNLRAHVPTIPLKFLVTESDERLGASPDSQVLSVSIHHGVVPRESISDKESRADEFSNYKVCSPGDIAINRMRAFQGGVGVVTDKGVVSPDYTVLRVGPRMRSEFMHFVMRSDWFISEMTRRLRGIGGADQGQVRTPRIGFADLGQITVPVPTLDRQREVAQGISEAQRRVDELSALLKSQLEVLAERRQALITAAVTGELEIPGVAA